MQTTLLSIGLALILALFAALAGPLLVNWNNHRAFFEAQATQLIGLPVHVGGAIDVRILPTPSITLRSIAIGDAGEASRLRAGALAISLGLGPLLRGEIHAVEMRLIGPELKLGLDRTGTIDGPSMVIGPKSERLSIERLMVESGRAIVTDETTGLRLVLDKLWFRGEVRSLSGPFRGEGGFSGADSLYRFRLSTGRMGGDGIKVKLTLEIVDRPMEVDAEGALSFDYGAPRFDGTVVVARPVGAVLANGKAAVNEPWRATSKVKATPTGVIFDQVEFQYGPDDRAMQLTGVAEAKFGEQPRLQGVFSARHLDLDRLVAKPDAMRRLPFAALKSFAEIFGSSLRPLLPTLLVLTVDQVTLGGANLLAVSTDLTFQDNGWNLDKLDFRAPGFTRAHADGRIELTGKSPGFAGSLKVDAADSMTFLGWLTGKGNPTPGPLKPLFVDGKVKLSTDRIEVDQLNAKLDRAALEGRFVYAASSGTRPASLNAELRAADLDFDDWLQVTDSMFGGVAFERPRSLDLAVTIDKARFAGFETRKAVVNVKSDGDVLDIKRLFVDGFGEVTLEASGRIDAQSSSPRGNIKLDLDARDLAGLIAATEKYAPAAAEPIRRLAGRQPAAKLRAVLGMESSGSGPAVKRTTAKIAVEGQIGIFRVNVGGSAGIQTGAFSLTDLARFAAGDVRFEGQLDAEDGAALLALLGLDRIVVTEKKPGRLKVAAAGPLNRDIRIDGRLTAGPIDINSKGNANLSAQAASVNFSQVHGTVGGSKIQGKLSVAFGSPMRIEGAIEADQVDVPIAFASMIGMPMQQIKTGDAWSLEPFTPSVSNLSGRIELNAARAVLSQQLVARSMRGVLQFSASKTAFEVLESQLAGGAMKGELAFFSSSEGLSSLNFIELKGADAAALFPNEGHPSVKGKLSLQVMIEGLGMTPAAFVGSLHGIGSIAIENAEFSGLNPNVFEALTRAVDLGISADTNQIKEFVNITLAKGYLPVTRAQSAIEIVGGQARLVEPLVEAQGAELKVAATVDLATATIDSTLTMSGSTAGDMAGRPAVSLVLKGAFATPRNSVNADSLAGWLALRAAERQSKRIETIEAARRAAGTKASSDLPIYGINPIKPTGGNGDDDDGHAMQNSQPPNDPGLTPTEPTGGIVGSNQLPPLPPPIVVAPEGKAAGRSGARAPRQHVR